MKKRFIAIFLAGGLMLGLCGCGGSGDASSTPEPAVVQTEIESISTETAEEATTGEPKNADEGGYSVDDLVELWSSGTLLREEIVVMAAAGEISDEVFEEFLSCMAENEDFIAQSEENSGSGSVAGDVDVDKLLTTYIVEFEDLDGYKIRETCRVSPIFTEDDAETMHALWTALGNDIATFPSEETFYDMGEHDTLEYIIGTYMVENLTDGFPITPNNPRSYTGVLVPEEDPSIPGLYIKDRYAYFAHAVETMVSYSSGIVYYDNFHDTAAISKAKMESDVWGPCTFIMAMPNISTPNQPDGYRYDKLQFKLCGNHHANMEEYAILKLKYYTKEVQ